MAESVEKLARECHWNARRANLPRVRMLVGRLVSGALRLARLPGLRVRLSETATPRAPMMADMA